MERGYPARLSAKREYLVLKVMSVLRTLAGRMPALR